MTAIDAEALLREPLTRLAAQLRARELSATELLQATFRQIDRANPVLNAIVTERRSEALAEAELADRAFERGGQPRPLEGIPFTVKDLIATAGLRTTAGSLLLRDHVPTWTAPAIQRLQAAGAILLGKSNCSEFGMGNLHTGNRLFGDTRNPWDLTRSPGGSSGGDSAAVAAGLSVFGVGTDYGGSVRWPAHCTGVASVRPTPGLLPTTGVLPHSGLADAPEPPDSTSFQCWIQTLGVIARSASDLTLLLNIMRGPDGRDSHAVPSSLISTAGVALTELRCAWFDDDGSGAVRADVRAAVRAASEALQARSMSVSPLRPPGFDRAVAAYELLRSAQGLPDHAAVVGDRLHDASTIVREALSTAPAPVSTDEYRRRAIEGDRIRAQILTLMDSWPILLLPVGTGPAFTPDSHEYMQPHTRVRRSEIENCSRAVSLLRAPAAVVPFGMSDEGLPLGVQVVGRPFHEAEVLAVAQALEEAFGVWRPAAVRSGGPGIGQQTSQASHALREVRER